MSLANSPRPLELTAAFLDYCNATALLDGPDGPSEHVVIGVPGELTPAQVADLRAVLAVAASVHRAKRAATLED